MMGRVMISDFRKRLKAGEKLVGTMVTLPTPSTAEILADIGFDWLFIDGEHGPLEIPDIQAILQTVDDKTACIVRVPKEDEAAIKRVLDIGAAGVIVPQVNTVEQAENVVRYSRYAPAGARGVGLARAHGYGFKFKGYVETANEQISVIVQAEHVDAVKNIEQIVKVPGVDAVLLGPYDLAASLGKMGQVDDPAVLEAIDHITKTCQNVGMPLGYFGVSAEAVLPYAEKGYSLLVGGVDVLFLGNGAARMRKALL